MPEGDAVRRTADRLDRALAGQAVVRAELRWPRAPGVDLVGSTVLGTGSYGKHLLTRFSHGWTLHTHLRMDGRWRVVPATGRPPGGRGLRAVVGVERWTALGLELGMLDLVRSRDEPRLLAHLGPDILAADFPAAGPREVAARALAEPGRAVAAALLDQGVVAGLGTIWVSEALWRTGTWPWAPVESVDLPRILATVRPPLARSAAGERVPASVHGRARRACRRCGTPVEVGTAGSPPRPMFFCPRCQPTG